MHFSGSRTTEWLEIVEREALALALEEPLAHAHRVGQVLQLAVAVALAGLAVLRVVVQQQLDDVAPGLAELRASWSGPPCPPTPGTRRRPCSSPCPSTSTMHTRQEPAQAQVGVVAQPRDADAERVGGLHDRRASGHRRPATPSIVRVILSSQLPWPHFLVHRVEPADLEAPAALDAARLVDRRAASSASPAMHVHRAVARAGGAADALLRDRSRSRSAPCRRSAGQRFSRTWASYSSRKCSSVLSTGFGAAWPRPHSDAFLTVSRQPLQLVEVVLRALARR